jgi:hypothetical protein
VKTTYDAARGNGVVQRVLRRGAPAVHGIRRRQRIPVAQAADARGFRVRDIFTDFKRHDLGAAFHERNFDGSVTTQFLTTPLWGVGSTAPYGHDGRSATLEDVIARHGGEAQAARDAFLSLPSSQREQVLAALRSLVLFSPPDTASNLEATDPSNPQYPLYGHGSINLRVLFDDPSEKE